MASTRLHTTKRAGAIALAIAAGSTGIITATAGGASAAGGSLDLASVRACESGGNYSINTGNGFYGAYQFDQQTWSGLGYSGSPSSASPATQDAAAQKLYSQRGTSPWPVCGRSSSGSASTATNGVARPSRSATRTAVPHSTSSTATSPKASTSQTSTVQRSSIVLSTALLNQKRRDVERAQQQLNDNGSQLVVDGYFGPRTEAATKAFQADHGLSADGEIGQLTRSALR